MPIEISLDNKVAIVTGGASGIGKAIANTLAEADAKVVIADIRFPFALLTLSELADEYLGKGNWGLERDGNYSRAVYEGETIYAAVKTDVKSKESIDAMVQYTIEKFGRIDILVNNAGISRQTPLLDISPEEWELVVGVNLYGTFLCSQAVIPYMIERIESDAEEREYGGRIINMSSKSGVRGSPRMAHYSAAKGGIIALTQSMAREFADDDILVYGMAPAIVWDSPIWQDEEFRRKQAERRGVTVEKLYSFFEDADPPVLCTMEDVAEVALRLCSYKRPKEFGIVYPVPGALEMMEMGN